MNKVELQAKVDALRDEINFLTTLYEMVRMFPIKRGKEGGGDVFGFDREGPESLSLERKPLVGAWGRGYNKGVLCGAGGAGRADAYSA